MSKNEHHVVPNSSRGGWDIKRSGTSRVSIHTATKAEAVKIGRVISQRAGSELVIHCSNGQIQRKDSYGSNSCHARNQK